MMKRIKLDKWMLLVPILCLFYVCCPGQKTVQVLTKTVDKRLDYKPGEELIIEAEKASLDIQGWDKNQIDVRLQLISKHPSKEIVEKEIHYLKYEIVKAGPNHRIKNYFQADKNFSKVKGTLLTKYVIKVPNGCKVTITNLYGNVSISDLNSELTGYLRFVDFSLSRGNGNTALESYFGNIRMEAYAGIVSARLEKTDMHVSTFDGAMELSSQYGKIDIVGGAFQRLVINGDRTEVNFEVSQMEYYNYDLNTSYSKIFLPKIFGVVKNAKDIQSFHRAFKNDNPAVEIKTKYSPIAVRLMHDTSEKRN